MNIVDAAIEVMSKFNKNTIWYGNGDMIHEIADVANIKNTHPTNLKSCVISVIAKSKQFRLSGRIEHNGHYHNVYETVASIPSKAGCNYDESVLSGHNRTTSGAIGQP